jgi:putative colanic acid biosynthesis glycosyltransferase
LSAEDPVFFSVITPVLNDRSRLLRTVDSMVGQAESKGDFEWIVIDGGSVDGTAKLLEQTPLGRLKTFSGEDSGPYHAMNRGTDFAAGRYVIYLSAGDTFAHRNVLREVKQFIRDRGDKPVVVYGRSAIAFPHGGTVPVPAHDVSYLRQGLPAPRQAMFFLRSALPSGPFDLQYKVAADYDLAARLQKSGGTWRRVPKTLVNLAGAGPAARRPLKALAEVAAVQKRVWGEPFGARVMGVARRTPAAFSLGLMRSKLGFRFAAPRDKAESDAEAK